MPAAALLLAGVASTDPEVAAPGPLPFELLGEAIEPGTLERVSLVASESFAGVSVRTPIVVAHGAEPGPVLCLTGGVHGDELNGVEIVRRTMEGLDPATLRGTVIGVPIANPQGFMRSSRYLPDRRDLNRYFPGRDQGSSASRIAHGLFENVIRRCSALVDFHTGSFHRTNVPHLRANLLDRGTRDLAERFGTSVIVHHHGGLGTLRRAAMDVGIPSVTYEGGEPMRLSEVEIRAGVVGTRHLMQGMGIFGLPAEDVPQKIHAKMHWVRATTGGLLLGRVRAGDRVEVDEYLGAVTDPISNERSEIRSPHRGMVIGQAIDQVVMPGFAAFHIALDDAVLEPEGFSEPSAEPDVEDAELVGPEPEERPE